MRPCHRRFCRRVGRFGEYETADPVERITAMTVTGKTTPADTVEIVMVRWSTDAERSQFLPILSGKPTKEGDALDKVSLGFVWGSGSVGYVVRYAERQGDRIILVVNRSLGSWQGKPNWITAPRSLTYQQLLLQIGNEAYEGIKWEHERGVSPRYCEDLRRHGVRSRASDQDGVPRARGEADRSHALECC